MSEIKPPKTLNASTSRCDDRFRLLASLTDRYPDYPMAVAAAAAARFHCTVEVLFDSLQWACSRPPGRDRADALRRIAANPDALADGRPVLESTPIDTAGWGVVQFVSVDSVTRVSFKDRRKERVCEVKLTALTGPPAPGVIVQTVSPDLLRLIARRVGFTRSNGKRPLQDDRELSGLRVLALFEPSGRADRPPKAIRFSPNRALLEWNVSLLTDRKRADPAVFVCPLSQPNDLPCWKCFAGRDRCRVAARPKTLQRRPCPSCAADGWFDPARPSDRCLVCQAKG